MLSQVVVVMIQTPIMQTPRKIHSGIVLTVQMRKTPLQIQRMLCMEVAANSNGNAEESNESSSDSGAGNYSDLSSMADEGSDLEH